MIKPKIKISADEVLHNFHAALEMIEDKRPLLKKILGKDEDKRSWTIKGSILKSFMTKTSPDGKSWPNLNLEYAKRKTKKYGPKPTLVATGDLFNSLCRSNSYTVSILTKSKLTYGTTLPYAKYHVLGGDIIPQRNFIGFGKDQKNKIIKLTAKYYADLLRKGKAD